MRKVYFFWFAVLFIPQAYAYVVPQQPSKAYHCERCNTLSHARLHTHWPIKETPLTTPTPNTHKSYSYNQIITAKELQKGIRLATSAPGAVIRISPLQDKSLPDLELKTPENQWISLKAASALFAQDEALNESMSISEHQTMLQIKPELGFGPFILKSKTNTADPKHTYLIHVFDKYSSIYLKLEPQALHYQYGDQFSANISLQDKSNSYSADEVHATLISADSQLIPLKLKKIKRNQFQASTPLLSELNTQGENWYIEAEVRSDKNHGLLQRSARTPFSYSIPSATILSVKKISSHPLILSAKINVTTASRYALQSVLLSKNKEEVLVPIEFSQSAEWLEPGIKNIEFSFDNSKQLEEDTLSVGYLHLTDYGQLKTVYQYNQPIQLSELMD